MDDEKKLPEYVVPEKVDNIEVSMVKDGAKFFGAIAVVVAIVLGIIRDLSSSWSVLFAAAIVIFNLYLSAIFIRAFARISPVAIMAGALGSFVLRLALIFLFALAVKNIAIFDFNVWLLAVAIGHVGLLAWETLRISKRLSIGDV